MHAITCFGYCCILHLLEVVIYLGIRKICGGGDDVDDVTSIKHSAIIHTPSIVFTLELV